MTELERGDFAGRTDYAGNDSYPVRCRHSSGSRVCSGRSEHDMPAGRPSGPDVVRGVRSTATEIVSERIQPMKRIDGCRTGPSVAGLFEGDFLSDRALGTGNESWSRPGPARERGRDAALEVQARRDFAVHDGARDVARYEGDGSGDQDQRQADYRSALERQEYCLRWPGRAGPDHRPHSDEGRGSRQRIRLRLAERQRTRRAECLAADPSDQGASRRGIHVQDERTG